MYVADAPWEQLPLTGGYHDWAFALGPRGFDVLHRADDIARAIEGAGLVMVLNAVVLCVAGLVVARRATLQQTERPPSLVPWDGVERAAARR